MKPEILNRLLAEPERGSSHDSSRRSLQLTDQESAILAAIAQGERTKEIALHLGITERTVKAHLAISYNKLGVDSRAAGAFPPPSD